VWTGSKQTSDLYNNFFTQKAM